MTKKNKSAPSEESSYAKAIGGGGLIYGGSKVSRYTRDKGHLTGRRNLYHGTPKKNLPGIMEKGLLASRSAKPGTITHDVLAGKIPEEKLKGKIYLGKKKGTARATNLGAMQRELLGGKSFGDLTRRSIIRASIPYEVYKKRKRIPNPELRGAKNWKEFKTSLKAPFVPDQQIKSAYKLLGPGTVVHQGDFSPEYIKGSKHYKKLGAKEFLDYVKKHRGRAAKGAGLTALALSGVIGGGALGYKGVKELLERERKSKKT